MLFNSFISHHAVSLLALLIVFAMHVSCIPCNTDGQFDSLSSFRRNPFIAFSLSRYSNLGDRAAVYPISSSIHSWKLYTHFSCKIVKEDEVECIPCLYANECFLAQEQSGKRLHIPQCGKRGTQTSSLRLRKRQTEKGMPEPPTLTKTGTPVWLTRLR